MSKLRPSAADERLHAKRLSAAFRAQTGKKNVLPSVQLPKYGIDVALPLSEPADARLVRPATRLVAIGTSAGGTQALETVLTALPLSAPGIIAVQHIPENFSDAFAHRLNKLCAIEVKEAQTGDVVRMGRALIAPGGKHMILQIVGGSYQVALLDAPPPVCRHKPSVDVLFRSVARFAGSNALGIIMTGMGDDGAEGLKEMHEAKAQTIAQDEKSCVVFGMPKEAIKRGAVDKVLSLTEIPQAILAYGRTGKI
jgi:two-component system chemotaxis response regulator CheB